MTYFGMPFGMWTMFAGSFQKQLTAVFGYDADTVKAIAKIAKPKYREIISELPEFEKADRFKMNIVNCAMIGAVHPLHAGTPGCGAADGVLCKIHDDKAHEMVLPQKRKEQIHRKGHCRYESHRRPESRRPQPLFVEYGFLRISRRQRLRGTLHQMRHLCADEKAGAI